MINLPKSYVAGLGTRNPLVCSLRRYPLGQQAWFIYCPVVEYTNFFLILGATTGEGTTMKQNYYPQCLVYKQQKFYKFFCPCTVDCSVGFLAKQYLQEMQIYSRGGGGAGREGAAVRNDSYSEEPVIKFL